MRQRCGAKGSPCLADHCSYKCGLFEKQSSFFFQAKAGYNSLINNIFFNGPRAGININVRAHAPDPTICMLKALDSGWFCRRQLARGQPHVQHGDGIRSVRSARPASHALHCSRLTALGDHGPVNTWDRQVYVAENYPDGSMKVNKTFDEIR